MHFSNQLRNFWTNLRNSPYEPMAGKGCSAMILLNKYERAAVVSHVGDS